MKRKFYIFLLLTLAGLAPACKKNLDVPPMNVVQDPDVFTTSNGITSYMARIYSELPIEDFKWGPNTGFKAYFYGSPSAITGEAISRDQQNSTETFGYWADAYLLIRECNYFMETLPDYASNFTPAEVNGWLGEARFIRAATYFALVKRYGGVPIIDKVLTKPGANIDDITQSIEELKVPRSSEEAVYDFIAADFDFAYANLPESNQKGRANKYAAAAFKSRAMLFAGSIAKYNNITLVAGSERLCGIPASKAADYFKASYDAAVLVQGRYSLYKNNWIAGNKDAQYQNFVNLFLDANSSENIFVRQYKYPDAAHWYDANNVPYQLTGGVSSETCPTLDFVEMFEGLPKNADGTIKTVDASGQYILYDRPLDLFTNAEPRLRATVIFPGDLFKNQNIEIRRGIYTQNSAGGIDKLVPFGSTSPYPSGKFVGSATVVQDAYVLPDKSKMNPAGLSGVFTNYSGQAGNISGFSIRKYLVPDKPTSEVQTNRSEQAWIELRYAEVLLNRAEAAYELYSLGQGGNYQQDALTDINAIRERAGASLLPSITNIDDIRMERRKELAFENKTWFDLRRWRIIDKEQNNTIYRILMPFYVADANKYFFDPRFDERNSRYTFDTKWYYEQIPPAVIGRSTNLVQNPGY
ncbi:RagB/SusD family nutrient uptake outer membrane protein [Mucilaginibacter sp. 14171R-50]|uniref:RagB/SusD family nutrient uptake outer membrane protein n=1 Tax=Mucilaginibacter sp. 14171R-50 TaxID=2703789 RepID=UPI00138CA8F7|nr:RagB/SusD family nutrient uptake outer membrane protein [Mucilaginibacter sp. 14171R-50]QHS54330.1 RagB/SusD family nutrient uptake outer membrane protein [Mucilaginibacter sp. 14171R-50]